MQTIMNKLITIKSISVLVLVLLVVLGSSFVKGTAQDPEPGPVYSAGNTVASSIAGNLHATISLYSVEDDIAAIEEVMSQYAVASNAGDFELWMSLMTDDTIKMPPDAPAIYGIEELRATYKPFFDNLTTEMVLYPEEAQVDGDMGLARGTYTFTMTPKAGGEPILGDGKYLTLCKRQADGSWKISHDCFNSNVPPAPPAQ